MLILIVDNDTKSLRNLERCIRECREKDEIVGFTNPVSALDYIREHEVGILFTEVWMREATGFTLAKRAKSKGKNTYVIFVTDSPEYAMHAWEAHVNGYLMKPVDLQKVRNELEYACREYA